MLAGPWLAEWGLTLTLTGTFRVSRQRGTVRFWTRKEHEDYGDPRSEEGYDTQSAAGQAAADACLWLLVEWSSVSGCGAPEDLG